MRVFAHRGLKRSVDGLLGELLENSAIMDIRMMKHNLLFFSLYSVKHKNM